MRLHLIAGVAIYSSQLHTTTMGPSCEHPPGPGERFCAQCGRQRGQRSVLVRRPEWDVLHDKIVIATHENVALNLINADGNYFIGVNLGDTYGDRERISIEKLAELDLPAMRERYRGYLEPLGMWGEFGIHAIAEDTGYR